MQRMISATGTEDDSTILDLVPPDAVIERYIGDIMSRRDFQMSHKLVQDPRGNVAWKDVEVESGYESSGNFSDTSSLKLLKTKGSIGHAFTVCIHTENQNQVSFYPFVPREISVLTELTLGHLRYRLTDVPANIRIKREEIARVSKQGCD